jgi:hypothetical protein
MGRAPAALQEVILRVLVAMMAIVLIVVTPNLI